jgi:putative phosphoesterase
MKVALLGDVHANLPALEATLMHARQNSVDAIWNLGDFVGYGAFPEEVIQVLRASQALSILGNYDRKVLKVEEKAAEWQARKLPEKWLAFKWSYDHLSQDCREYLRSLPEQIRLKMDRQRILLVHGSPSSREEHLTPVTPQPRLEELADQARADIILCAHSHVSFARQAKGSWIVNPGSVGRPDDGDARASYAILSFSGGQFEVEFYRIVYDVARAAAAIRQAHLPESFAQMVLLGRNLDWINANPDQGS